MDAHTGQAARGGRGVEGQAGIQGGTGHMEGIQEQHHPLGHPGHSPEASTRQGGRQHGPQGVEAARATQVGGPLVGH